MEHKLEIDGQTFVVNIKTISEKLRGHVVMDSLISGADDRSIRYMVGVDYRDSSICTSHHQKLVELLEASFSSSQVKKALDDIDLWFLEQAHRFVRGEQASLMSRP